jgi:restriction endonuclease S subunit
MSYGVKLRAISEIKTGHTFRGKVPSSIEGTVTVFQPKDIENGVITAEQLKVQESTVSVINKHLLQVGDILLANKGIKFSTFIYNGCPTNAIATSSFFVIRPDANRVLPEYLLWFLREEEVLSFLAQSVVGSTIQSITLSVTENIPIRLPETKIQRRIVEMVSCIKNEEACMQSYIKIRKDFLGAFCWELLDSEK